MKEIVFDIEGNGFLDEITRVWVLSYRDEQGNVVSLTKYEDIIEFLSDEQNILIAHNVYAFDKPALEKILGIEIKARVVDTLSLSWYLYPKEPKHGLEEWGERLGVKKTEVNDDSWDDEKLMPLYIERCESDVKIGSMLWDKIKSDLLDIYESEKDYWRLIDYLDFKMHCSALKQKSRWKLDKEYALQLLSTFDEKITKAKEELFEAMPKVVKYRKALRPKKPYKKDGTLSATGVKWKKITEENNVDFDYNGEIKVISKYEDPNPGSVPQIKDWLFSLGWQPTKYSYKRNKETNETKRIPQLKDKDSGELCADIIRLSEHNPSLENLVDLSILIHRNGLVKGFIDNVDKNGFVIAEKQGLTNCVTADTIITTNRGALPIVEVNKEDQVLTHTGKWKQVTDWISNGVRDVYEVTTDTGKKVKCTHNHRFFDGQNWIKTEDLKTGELIQGYGRKEIWKEIVDSKEPCAISSWGRFRKSDGKISYYRKRVNKEIRSNSSYIRKDGSQTDVQTSRLVLQYFEGESGLHALHKDGKSCNNNLQNLYYGTDRDNWGDTHKHGTHVRATRKNSKITQDDVSNMKIMRNEGFTNVEIGKRYDISDSYVSMILSDKRRSDSKTEHNKYLEVFDYEKVASVNYIGKEPTYDISVDQDHSYIANGLVTHNTLRWKHKICVNIPSLRTLYGEEIRSLLTARNDDYELCGSDMSSLEDRTKQHYMWPIDPDYVKEMQTEDFDPHCDIAIAAGLMTKYEVNAYKHMSRNDLSELKGERGCYIKKDLDKKRYLGKQTNYASTYGAGANTIARSAGVSQSVGKKLFQAYWDRNWSIKEIAKQCEVKYSRDLMWLKNPVSKLWYHLKYDKDRFSTLNQGTATYCFDKWLEEVLKTREQLTGDFHDEGIWEVRVGHREQMENLLKTSVKQVNKDLKLNRELDCDVQFGKTYAGIH